MNCKNCGNKKLSSISKFCDKCGKPIEIVNVSKTKIEKNKKSIKNTGESVYAIGWLTIVTNAGLYIWSIADKNFFESGLPAANLTGAFIMITIAIVFIILGSRIKKLADKKIKQYLQILLILSVLLLIWIVLTGGRVGLLFILVTFYLISSLTTISKLMREEAFASTLINPEYKLNKNGWIIFSVSALILLFIIIGINSIGNNAVRDNNISKNNINIPEQKLVNQIVGDNTVGAIQGETSNSKEELIQQIVESAKSQTTFPVELDSVTTMVDITAESNAIRYQYILHDLETSALSDEYFKNSIILSLCGNKNLTSILNEGINLEYSYTVKDSQQTYFTYFTKTDCSIKSNETSKDSINTAQLSTSRYEKVALLSDRMDSEIRLIGDLVKPGEKIALYDYNLDETANGISLYEKNGGWLLKQEYYCSKNISSQVENISKKTGVTYYKGDFDLVSLDDFKNYLSQNNANCIQVLDLERSGKTKKVLAYGLEADGMVIWKNR